MGAQLARAAPPDPRASRTGTDEGRGCGLVGGGDARRRRVASAVGLQATTPYFPTQASHFRGVGSVAILPDGTLITGGREDTKLLLWAARGHAPPQLLGATSDWSALIVVVSGEHVIAVSGHGEEAHWDPRQPGQPPLWKAPAVGPMAVLSDGRVIAGQPDGQVQIRATDGRDILALTRTAHEHPIAALAADSSGHFVTLQRDVATNGSVNNILVLWDREHLTEPQAQLALEPGTTTLAPLDEGGFVVGTASGQVIAWNPTAGDPAPTEIGRHTGPVVATGGAFGPQMAVTAGADLRVLVWDAHRPGNPNLRDATPRRTLLGLRGHRPRSTGRGPRCLRDLGVGDAEPPEWGLSRPRPPPTRSPRHTQRTSRNRGHGSRLTSTHSHGNGV